MKRCHSIFGIATVCAVLVVSSIGCQLATAQDKVVWSAEEQPIVDQIRGLRALPDEVRAQTTKDLAIKIRKLPASENKLRLAVGLAGRSTEGDFGHDTLQEVTTTLADSLREHPLPWPEPKRSDEKAPSEKTQASAVKQAAPAYLELATLVRYEHTQAMLDDPQFAAAMAQLEAEDQKRQSPDFSLKDLSGKEWKLRDLRGKVVLVNFWATWCPPCRKEMPDLVNLYQRFHAKGFVVLAISDEEKSKVEPFIRERHVSFPVLLDRKRKVNEMFAVDGIPKSFVYDRSGELVAQSIDMRTQKQFLEMLAKAGLE
jgi:peroxiredoxin